MKKQERLWSSDFGDHYAGRNIEFSEPLELLAWQKMLDKVPEREVGSILECGSNMGRNLLTLRKIFPAIELSLIEINKNSFEVAIKKIQPKHAYQGSIIASDFDVLFDLVFTCGVLIHIAPYDLYKNMEKIFNYSKKYILIAEYFARTLEMRLYHGQENQLFKMDFGGFFMDNFEAKLLDYGFLWGREFDDGGFDDITWWLFEKTL